MSREKGSPMYQLLALESFGSVIGAVAVSLVVGIVSIFLPSEWSTPMRLRLLLSAGTGYLLALALIELLPHCHAHLNKSVIKTLILLLSGAFIVFSTEKIVQWARSAKAVDSKPAIPIFVPVQHSHNKVSLFKGSHKACCEIHTHHSLPREIVISAVACIMVCAFFDGLTLSAALIAGGNTQLALAGVVAHVVPEIMLVGVLTKAHFAPSIAKALLACIAASMSFFLGNIASRTAYWLGASEAYLLGIAAGMMCYIAFAHLLPKFTSSRVQLLAVAAGFSLFMLTDLLHVHHV